jgi:hypothetical protein
VIDAFFALAHPRFAHHEPVMSMPTHIRSEWLKEQLQQPGRSQAALARYMGLHQSSVNRLVNGTRELKAREVDLVRQYLAETEHAQRRDERKPTPQGASPAEEIAKAFVAEPDEVDRLFNLSDFEFISVIYSSLSEAASNAVRNRLKLSDDDKASLLAPGSPLLDFVTKVVFLEGMDVIASETRKRLEAISVIYEGMKGLGGAATFSPDMIKGIFAAFGPRSLRQHNAEFARLVLLLQYVAIRTVLQSGYDVANRDMARASDTLLLTPWLSRP